MNIKELKDYLILKKIPQDMYSLGGGLPNESYCIEKEKEKWHFYYSERGVKRTIGYFEKEDEVVEAFLRKVGNDTGMAIR